ncbi:Mariner Mos1 transposase [Eumeta japonica]|uniref:Mariner Mos1 transposase n=1 Tax=Eumeta variegata TaxID=151549 RepID=A0A4C1ULX9_EUMVA|nr:Mariner Mos1 transposase [Eumeta japonica]
MLFTSCWVVYMLRVNMSLNIIAMVDSKKDNEKPKSKALVEEIGNQKTADLDDILSRQQGPVTMDDGLKNGSRRDIANVFSTEAASRAADDKSGRTSENISPSTAGSDVSTQTEATTAGDILSLQSTILQPRNRSQRHSDKSAAPNDGEEAIQPVDKPKKRSQGENIDEEKFDWSEQEQALILGSYFWLYPVTSLVGGTAAERWGTRSVVFWSSMVAALFTALGPPAARLHYSAVIFTRAIIGAAGLGVVYYELLNPSEAITGTLYRIPLMILSRALKEKRPQYYSRYDKIILLHDNARPHVPVPVKIYLKTLNWEVLPHPPYSPDIVSSDYHQFRSMAHAILEQRFTSYENTKNCVDSWIALKDKGFFRLRICTLPEKWKKVVASDGQYFD